MRNKAKRAAASKAYWKANRPRLLAQQKEYRMAHKAEKYAYKKLWNKRNAERYKATALRSNLKRVGGLTLEGYKAMLAQQEGRCAICLGVTDRQRLGIDHDHQTGKIRGLLCDHCNKGIGFFNDNVITLARAISYLEAKGDTP